MKAKWCFVFLKDSFYWAASFLLCSHASLIILIVFNTGAFLADFICSHHAWNRLIRIWYYFHHIISSFFLLWRIFFMVNVFFPSFSNLSNQVKFAAFLVKNYNFFPNWYTSCMHLFIMISTKISNWKARFSNSFKCIIFYP